MTASPRPLTAALLTVSAALLLALTACSPSGSATLPESTGSPAPAPPSTAAPAPVATPEPEPTPEKVVATPADPRPFSEPETIPQQLSYGMSSELVRELQIRLRHAKYLAEYDATDSFGDRTQQAVLRFQADHGIPQTGVVGQLTWDALLPKSHEPTSAELNNTNVGPWYTGPTHAGFIMELQHRLGQVGLYDGAVDGEFSEPVKRAIGDFRTSIGLPASEVMDERTITQLRSRTYNPAYDELFDAPPASDLDHDLDPRCTTGKVICISKEQRKMSLVVDGQILLTRDARFSAPGWDSPTGDYQVWYMDADEVSVIFGERTPMPYAIYYNRDIAIHFSDNFADYGYEGGSHGCTQSYDYQAMKWLYEQTSVGDRVVVY
ncbi:MAG: L,D-transpeptidase family protein [Brooklawnia sp.]